MTHAELVARAAAWLRNHKRCGLVFTPTYFAGRAEIPDALGFCLSGRLSIVVECKTSRADLLRDAKKPHRVNPWLGMGTARYYMSEPGLVTPDVFGDEAQHWFAPWGILEVVGRRVVVVRESSEHGSRDEADAIRLNAVGYLYSAALRAANREKGVTK